MLNECCKHLARQVTALVASNLTDEEYRDLFMKLVACFQEALVNYETKRERMLARLGRPEAVERTDGS
jgi:hypothetical protein